MAAITTGMRLAGASIVHGGLIGVAVYYDSLSTEAVIFLIFEVLVYLSLLSSDPGYIQTNNSMDHHERLAGSEGEFKSNDIEEEADDMDPNPLIPLHWSKMNWKMGAGIDDRLPAAPKCLRAWCSICQLSPPIRSHHCIVCNKCVAQYECHNMMCSCIGERNRARYTLWLASACWFIGRVLYDVLSYEFKYDDDMSFNKFISLNSRFISLSSMIWCLFIFFTFSFLLSLFAACVNMSVYELFQYRYLLPYMRGYGMCDFPFNRGFCYNLYKYVRSDGCFSKRAAEWKPEIVELPGEPNKDGELCENLLENKYYSCC